MPTQKDQIKRFLHAISMNETSGGKNLDHETMQSGIHQGSTAVGAYGLMPNTVQEMHRRMRNEGRSDFDPDVVNADPQQVEELLRSNPGLQQQAAEYMASHLINKTGGDLDAAAYGWRYGHNQSPDDLIEKSIDNPYVQSFDRYLKESQRIQPASTNFSGTKSKLRGK